MNDEARAGQQQESDPDAGLIDLRQLFALMWSRRLIIIVIFALFLLAGIAYVAVTPSTYVAEAVLLIDPKQPNIAPSAPVIDGGGMDAAMLESQVEIMTSSQLLLPLFRDLKLGQDSEFSGGGLLSGLLSQNGSKPVDEQAAFDKFVKGLTVARRGLTYILTVDFKSKNAEKAAQIANAVSNRYVSEQIAKKNGTARQVTSVLEDRLVELRAGVDSAERAIEDFKVSQGYVNLDNGPALPETALMQATQQLSATNGAAEAAQARFQQLDNASKRADFAALDSATATQLRAQYNAKSSELDRMTSTMGERHPLIQALRMELTGLRRQMQAEAQRIVSVAKLDADVANRNLSVIKSKVSSLSNGMDGIRQSEVKLRALEREADARRAVLEEYLKRSRETGEQQSTARPDAEVLSAAVPPSRASWPKVPVVLAVAGFLGLAIGIVVAFLQGRVQPPVVPVRVPEAERRMPEPERRAPDAPLPSLLSYPSHDEREQNRSSGSGSRWPYSDRL